MTLVSVTAVETLTIVTGAGQAALDQLALTPNGEPTRRCLLIPGVDVAWDSCQCGQFAQVIVSEYATSNPFDGGNTAVSTCQLPYRVIVVGSSIVRCVPTVDENGFAPTCDQYLAASVNDVLDRAAVRLGIQCFLQGLLDGHRIEHYSLGPQVPLGEQGGCAGSALTWQVSVINRCMTC